MRTCSSLLAGLIVTLFSYPSRAAVLYVDVNSGSASPPYTNWASAANKIQDAVDLATDGDLILVADGVYYSGNTNVGGGASRVVLLRQVTVQSVNGPAVTTIAGQVSNPAIRSVHMNDGAKLIGFTLSGGRGVTDGGGALCAPGAILSNCVISGNVALRVGGGVRGGILYNCRVTGNSAPGYNSIYNGYGGGVYESTCYNCTLDGNWANYIGGGSGNSTLNGCLLTGNYVSPTTGWGWGGAAWGGTLNGCTVVNNWIYYGNIVIDGGGTSSTTVSNSIVYNNTPNNISAGTVNYCCTIPLPAEGEGNFALDPLFVNPAAGNYHLQSNSPCINSGDNGSAVTGSDLDGNPRITAGYLDIGAYELPSALPPNAWIMADYTNVLMGFATSFEASFAWGHATTANWNFGDGTTLSNTLGCSHAWTSPGDYTVSAQVCSANNPTGLVATATIHVASEIVYYVDAAGTNPIPPYSSLQTAATNIQDAIDVATPAQGSLVLVRDGVYNSGARVAIGALSNRVAVTKPIRIQSINGPSVTIIQGKQTSSSRYGDGSIRCIYLTNNASLSGFTLTGGSTRIAGTANQDQSGGAVWCASTNSLVTNCFLLNNSARWMGGGAFGGTLSGCTLNGNRAEYQAGGGAESSLLYNCVLHSNFAGATGGAVDQCSLFNCQVAGNSASLIGGGSSSSLLVNCTLTGNSAGTSGGGASDCEATNCIICFNYAPDAKNALRGVSDHCCSAPLLPGPGNIDGEPQIPDGVHLAAGSPCRGAGVSVMTIGTDIDGEPWLSPPSLGCDEFKITPLTGPLSVTIHAQYTNLASGFILGLDVAVSGRTANLTWSFGDGTFATNTPAVWKSWDSAGDYVVTVTATNEVHPTGVSDGVTIHVANQPIHYVSQDSANPIAPYFSWSTAATNIQDAVDAGYPGSLVLVSNGIYQAGGRIVFGALTNRVVVDKALTVQSVNGPNTAFIQGNPATNDTAVRCVYLANYATLIGFTLQQGGTRNQGEPIQEQSGAGVWCASSNSLLLNCVVISNTAVQFGGGSYSGSHSNCLFSLNKADTGGGSFGGRLLSCTSTINSAKNGGGAASNSLNLCTLLANKASFGGGAHGAALTNCTVALNTNSSTGGGLYACTASGCAITNNQGSGGFSSAGGAYQSTLVNCLILNNTAAQSGGGVALCAVNNSFVMGNRAATGSAGYQSTFNNCVISSNWGSSIALYFSSLNNCSVVGHTNGVTAQGGVIRNSIVYYNANNYSGSLCSNCCIFPLPSGAGNFSNPPSFYNLAAGDLRLQSNSPCINAGNNLYVTDSTDLAGLPRLSGSAVDIGAYELQNPASQISYYWLQLYGLPLDGTADLSDPDGDHFNNWQEWIAGTVPTNSASLLRFLTPTQSVSGCKLTWESVSGKKYLIQRSTNLTLQSTFSTIQSNINGRTGTTTYTDSTATNQGAYFYRVGVQ